MTKQSPVYPFREKAMVFCRATLKGRDPLLEVALVGLSKDGIDERAKERYTEKVLISGWLDMFARKGKGMFTRLAQDICISDVKSQPEKAPVFVFDE
ncbi:MAG: hypothetical protein U0R44_06335 [Candidatus Micrarchaeia archaeon]